MTDAAHDAAEPFEPAGAPTPRKPSFAIGEGLRGYLANYKRERPLPITYERLCDFHETIPLVNRDGHPTLWDTVIYRHDEMGPLYEELKATYALLKVDGDSRVVRHLYIDRVDFCSFGNSMPFRVRIVNSFNDNQDYFYVKRADASRVYGLELEHLLSPSRLNFITHGNTLVEEHVAGIPGDVFINTWLRSPELLPVRVAKELVKFNERCFLRLLGDMRAYNFVFVITPDFEAAQVRIRAMDFDQQSYNGRKKFYLPQFFKENAALVRYCTKHLHLETALQYQREEHTLIVGRAELARVRLAELLHEMSADAIAPHEKIHHLRAELADHFQRSDYLRCESMGALVQQNLLTLRETIARHSPTPIDLESFA